jgi:hypothetical protein
MAVGDLARLDAPRAAGDLARLDAAGLWAAVRGAAAGDREGVAGTVARLCIAAGSPRLGWVAPPPWEQVRNGLAAVSAGLGQPDAGTVPGEPDAGTVTVLLGTGGWSFAARALCEAAGPPRRLVALDSLHPVAIRRALAHAGTVAPRCLVVSGSGTTLETGCLADVLTELAGDGRRPRTVRLSDHARPPDVFALSARGLPEHVAMLGAPLSTAFLAPAALVDPAALAAGYARVRWPQVAAAAVERAVGTTVDGAPLVQLVAPAWAGRGLRLWLLQLGRQVLCGKSDRFRPWVEVTTPNRSTMEDGATRRADAQGVRYDPGEVPRGLPGLLEVMYAACVFVACLALRAGVAVAEHANVRAYKRLVDSVAVDAALPRVPARGLPGLAAAWLAGRPEVRRLHVVRYDRATVPDAARGFARATGRSCEVHEGTAWNHHSFQAVYADPGTAALVVAPPLPAGGPPALARAAYTLRRVALATGQALAERATVVQVVAGGGVT